MSSPYPLFLFIHLLYLYTMSYTLYTTLWPLAYTLSPRLNVHPPPPYSTPHQSIPALHPSHPCCCWMLPPLVYIKINVPITPYISISITIPITPLSLLISLSLPLSLVLSLSLPLSLVLSLSLFLSLSLPLSLSYPSLYHYLLTSSI